jgi:hypothetical protein
VYASSPLLTLTKTGSLPSRKTEVGSALKKTKEEA